MRITLTTLTLLLFVGCATKEEDDDSGFDSYTSNPNGTSGAGTGSGETTAGDTTGGDTTDGGTTDGGTTDGGDGESGGTNDGGAEEGGDTSDGGGESGGGTSDGEGTGAGDEIAIAGNYWNSTLSASYAITSATLTENNSPPAATTYVWDLTTFSNAERYAIGQTPAGYWAGPGWTRFDWVVESDTLYLCMTVNDAVDEAAALATEPADGSDLEDGCAAVVGWMPLDPM